MRGGGTHERENEKGEKGVKSEKWEYREERQEVRRTGEEGNGDERRDGRKKETEVERRLGK